MADNIDVLNAGGTAATWAADEISSVKYQRTKLIHGADGTNDGDVSRANGLPVGDSQIIAQSDLVEKGHATFTTSYVDMALSGLSTATSVYIDNDTDGDLYFNWDNGANADFIVRARTARPVPVLAGNTGLFSKYKTDPTTGTCYFEVRRG